MSADSTVKTCLICLIKIWLFLLIALFFMEFRGIFAQTHTIIRDFLDAGGHLVSGRAEGYFLDTEKACEEAITLIPEDAKIKITYRGSLDNWRGRGEVNRMRYRLYPRTVSHVDDADFAWDYLLDFAGGYPYWKDVSPSRLSMRELSNGVAVYAKSPHSFLDPSSAPSTRTGAGLSLRSCSAFFVMQLLYLLTGVGVLGLLRINHDDGGCFWFVSTAYLLGIIVLTSLLWLAMLLDVRIDTWKVVSVCVLCPLVLLALGVKNLKCATATGKGSGPARVSSPFFSDPLAICLMVFACTVIIALVICAALVRVETYDACAHWVFKAKVLFQHRSILPYGSLFKAPNHPFFWPLTIATQFVLSGGTYDHIAKWTVAMLLIAFFIQLHSALTRMGLSRRYVWLFVIIYLGCFMTPLGTMTSAYAKAMAMAFFTAMLSCIVAWHRSNENGRFLVLSIMMSAGLVLTKSEGEVIVLAYSACLLLLSKRGLFAKKTWLIFFASALPVCLGIAWSTWLICHDQLIPYQYHHESPITPGKIWLLFNSLLDKTSRIGLGHRLFGGVCLLAILFSRKRWSELSIFFFSLSAFLIFFGGMSIIGWSETRIAETSVAVQRRLVFYATVPILLAVASLFHEFRSEAKEEPPEWQR